MKVYRLSGVRISRLELTITGLDARGKRLDWLMLVLNKTTCWSAKAIEYLTV